MVAGVVILQGHHESSVEILPLSSLASPSSTRELVLHVGMPKTGSTTIQNALKKLDDAQDYSPPMANFRNQTEVILRAFDRNAERYFRQKRVEKGYIAKPHDRMDAKRAISAALRAAGGRRIFLSGESLSMRLDRATLIKLRDWFSKRGRQIRIIAYLRPPIAAASASLHQGIRSKVLTELRIKTPLYADMEKFVSVFGEERVEFIPYDVSQFADGDVLKDFAKRLDVTMPLTRHRRSNRSNSLQLSAMLFAFNRQFQDRPTREVIWAKGAIAKHVGFPDGDKLTLHPELVEQNLRAKHVNWLDETMPPDFLDETVSGPLIASEGDLLSHDPGYHPGLEAALESVEGADNLSDMIRTFAESRR